MHLVHVCWRSCSPRSRSCSRPPDVDDDDDDGGRNVGLFVRASKYITQKRIVACRSTRIRWAVCRRCNADKNNGPIIRRTHWTACVCRAEECSMSLRVCVCVQLLAYVCISLLCPFRSGRCNGHAEAAICLAAHYSEYKLVRAPNAAIVSDPLPRTIRWRLAGWLAGGRNVPSFCSCGSCR